MDNIKKYPVGRSWSGWGNIIRQQCQYEKLAPFDWGQGLLESPCEYGIQLPGFINQRNGT